MVVIHHWLLQRYQTSKDSNLTFVDQKSQNYVIFMKSVWKRCKSNLNNNKNVNIPSRQCGQKKKCHFDIITEDPGSYFNEISVIRAFQRHHITLLESKVEVILISARSARAWHRAKSDEFAHALYRISFYLLYLTKLLHRYHVNVIIALFAETMISKFDN